MSGKCFVLIGLVASLGCLMAQSAAAQSQPHLKRHAAVARHVVVESVYPWARGGNWVNGFRPAPYPARAYSYDPACGLPSSACPNNERNFD
jgi:hypothetical protein